MIKISIIWGNNCVVWLHPGKTYHQQELEERYSIPINSVEISLLLFTRIYLWIIFLKLFYFTRRQWVKDGITVSVYKRHHYNKLSQHTECSSNSIQFHKKVYMNFEFYLIYHFSNFSATCFHTINNHYWFWHFTPISFALVQPHWG